MRGEIRLHQCQEPAHWPAFNERLSIHDLILPRRPNGGAAGEDARPTGPYLLRGGGFAQAAGVADARGYSGVIEIVQ